MHSPCKVRCENLIVLYFDDIARKSQCKRSTVKFYMNLLPSLLIFWPSFSGRYKSDFLNEVPFLSELRCKSIKAFLEDFS